MQGEDSSCSMFLNQVKSTLKEQIDALNDENEKLHQMANDFRRSRELLEDELEDMRSKERSFKWEMEQKTRDLFRLEAQLENCRKEMIALKEEVAGLKVDKEFAEKSREEMKTKIIQLENIRHELEYEVSALKTSEISLKSSLKREQQQNEDLIAERDLLKQDSNALKEKNMQVMSEKVSLESQLEQNQVEVFSLKNAIDESIKIRNELEARLSNRANDIQREFEAKLQKERLMRVKECDSLKHEFEMEKIAWDTRNEDIVNQLKVEKERQIGEYQEEMSKLRLELKVNEQQYIEKVTQLEREKLSFEIQSQREKNALTANLSEKEAVLNYKLSEIEETARKMTEMEELKNKLEVKLSEMENMRCRESNNHQQIIDSLNIQLLDLTNEKFCLEEEKNSLLLKLQREKNEQLNSSQSLKEATDQLDELRFNYDKLKERNAELRAQRDSIEKEVRVKEEKINSLTSLLKVKEEECMNLLQSIENYEKKLADEETLKEDLTKDMNELRSSLMDIEKSRLELKKQINNNNAFQKSLENDLKAKVAIIDEMNVIIEKKAEKEKQKQEELNKLKNLVIELDTEKETLKSEVVNLRHRLNDCEHIINLEKTTSKKQGEELRRLSAENSTLELNLSKCEEDSFTSKTNAKSYEQKVSNLEAKIAKLVKEKHDNDDALLKLNSIVIKCLKISPPSLSVNLPIGADTVRSNLLDLISKFNTNIEEKDNLRMQQKSFEQFSRSIQENNASLKVKIDTLEEELSFKRKHINSLTKEIEELKNKYQKQEEALEKAKMEKKYLCGRVAQLSTQTEKLEKEKKKLSREIESVQNSMSVNEGEITESRDIAESKIKRLDAAKRSLDSRVADLVKQLSDVNVENESLKHEMKVLKVTIKELQDSNLKLHSKLNDSSVALKRSSEEEQELKRKVSTMSEYIGDHDFLSKDVSQQLQSLQSKVDELTSERAFLQQTIDVNRESLTNMKTTNRQLNHRIKQLEAELNLTVTKMKSNESQLNEKSDALIEKEAKIKQLQQDLSRVQERYKHLEADRKSYLYNSTPQSKRKVNNSSFKDDSLVISQGLAALEEQNVKLQHKVKSLQSLMNESESHNNELSKLKTAQKQAESLLEVREKSHKNHVDSLHGEISSLKDQLESFQLTSTPSRFLNSPVKHSTSTPKRRLNL